MNIKEILTDNGIKIVEKDTDKLPLSEIEFDKAIFAKSGMDLRDVILHYFKKYDVNETRLSFYLRDNTDFPYLGGSYKYLVKTIPKIILSENCEVLLDIALSFLKKYNEIDFIRKLFWGLHIESVRFGTIHILITFDKFKILIDLKDEYIDIESENWKYHIDFNAGEFSEQKSEFYINESMDIKKEFKFIKTYCLHEQENYYNKKRITGLDELFTIINDTLFNGKRYK